MSWTGCIQEYKKDKPSVSFGRVINTQILNISTETYKILKERNKDVKKD